MSIGDRRWCTAHHFFTSVADEFIETTYDGGAGGAHEYGYLVQFLACGHEIVTEPREVGPAPGEPYADRPAAASTRAADLARANRQEQPE